MKRDMSRHIDSALGLAVVMAAVLVLAPRPAQAFSLLEKDDPTVAKGNELYRAGKFEEALQTYEQAAQEHPTSAQVQFDRGNALLKLGKRDEARDAYERAASAPDANLRSRDFYNMGNALAEMNQEDAAIRAYRRSLQIDPQNGDARHNLEVLLLHKNRPKSPQQQQKHPSPDAGEKGDGGRPDAGPDAGAQDGGMDGGKPDQPDGGAQDGGAGRDGGPSDGGANDGGPSDAGQGDGGPSDGGQGDGGQGDGGSRSDGGRPQDAGANPNQGQQGGSDGGGQDGGEQTPPEDMQQGGGPDAGADAAHQKAIDKQDAERLLDSLRRNEKNLQLWKFKPKGVKRPKDVDKDW